MRCLLFFAAVVPICAHDWVIVPGERVGPVTANATEAGLRAAFGDGAVTRATIHIDAKTAAPGVEIYRGKPGESLAVVWPRQERGLWWPLLVIPCHGSNGADCRWRTTSGVRPGATLTEVERMNGKPFLLYPDSAARAWTEPRWQEGALARELGEDVELFFGALPEEEFFADQTLMPTGDQRLNQGARRIDRMFIFLLSGKRVAPHNDWTVGGPFWKMLTGAAVAPLRETLGASAVQRTIMLGEEGIGDLPAIRIFGGQEDAAVARMLSADGRVETCGEREACRWRLPYGIPWKMPLADAQQRNGRAFVFNGFNFDLGGRITSWEGGRIPKLIGGALIVVECEDGYPDRMVGEVQLRSDDPEFRKLKCWVSVYAF